MNLIFINRWMVFYALMIISNYVIPMELSERPYLVIEDGFGNLFSVQKSLALNCSLIRKSLAEPHVEDEATCDLSFKCFKDPSLSLHDNAYLHASILYKVFECIEDVLRYQNDNAIQDIFNAADLLGAPQDVLRQLTFLIHKKVAKDNQNVAVAEMLYLNSVQSFINDGYFVASNKNAYLKKICKDEQETNELCLNLAHRKLDSLKGIKALSTLLSNEPIIKIKLNNNCLKKLNLKKLVSRFFPKLKVLKARNNKIKKITMIDELSENFIFDLENNRIKEISSFVARKGVYMNLKGNRLALQSQERLDRAFPLPLFSSMEKLIKFKIKDTSIQ